ncbi:MAG TPA: hypothetical protein VFB55_11555 [Verrucomicrobiae bacterium]|nr:hypothetical protein [Verrucomicrobiae bacterium]
MATKLADGKSHIQSHASRRGVPKARSKVKNNEGKNKNEIQSMTTSAWNPPVRKKWGH